MTGILVVAAVLVALVLAVWVGHRMVSAPRTGSTSGGDAFGGFADVFDPGRDRARRDLESRETEGEQAPTPTDDDRPVRVDLDAGTIHIRRPR